MPTFPGLNYLAAVTSRLMATVTTPTNDMGRVLVTAVEQGRWTDVYGMLEMYYGNNALYDSLARQLYEAGIQHEGMKALRNPTYRVVEFYATKIWGAYGDELQIESDNDSLENPIRKVWKWSNWQTKKTFAGRQLAMKGDQFIKVAASGEGGNGRVFFQLLEPAHVTDFDLDLRDNIVWARIDVPSSRRGPSGLPQPFLYTEVWSAAAGTLTVYESTKTPDTPLDQLGPGAITELASYGIDFVPIVLSRFKDVGQKRGRAAIFAALDKVDEANRQATRLYQMQFRNSKVTWALSANQVGADGRPISAPRVQPDDPAAAATGTPDPYSLYVGDDRMYRLPGNTSLQALVPDLKYDAMLATLQDQMKEIGADLPELAYYAVRDMRDISGKAVRLLLSDTIDRALEARGNQFTGAQRAMMMALTMGQAMQLPDFLGLGEFDQGDLEHTIVAPDIIPESDADKADRRSVEATTATTLHDLGVSRETLVEEMGYDAQDEATKREAEDEAAQDTMLTAFERGDSRFAGGGGGGARNLGGAA